MHDDPALKPPPARTGGREKSKHTLHDDDAPDVRFGGNVGDAGDPGSYGTEGNLRDFTDETSAGHHAGYGDYGQEDYGPHGDKVGAAGKKRVAAKKAAGKKAAGRKTERESGDPGTQAAVGRSTPKTG